MKIMENLNKMEIIENLKWKNRIMENRKRIMEI